MTVRQKSKTGATLQPMRDWERILGQIERGEVLAGPEGARKIAQKITAQGGFWAMQGKKTDG